MKNDDFLDIFRKNSIAMLIVDINELNIIDANYAALNFYKYSQEEISKKTLSDIDYRTASLINRGAHLISKLDDDFTFEHLLKTGQTRRVKVSASNINIFNKTAVLLIIVDITNRIITEEELKKSKERLKFFTDISREVVLVTEDDIIIDANSAIRTQFGWELHEIIGRELSSLFKEDISMKLAKSNPIVNGQKKLESEFLHRNGDQASVEVYTFRETYNDNEVLVVLIKDVTARKRNENIINEQKKYVQNILDSQPALITVWDKGKVIDTNKSFLSFFEVADTTEFNQIYPNFTSRLIKMEGYLYANNGGDFIEKAYKNKQNDMETKVALNALHSKNILFFQVDVSMISGHGKYVATFVDITELEADKNMLKKINTFLESEVEAITSKVNEANLELKTKEVLLIQQSKMAAMGEMIGAIAHQWKQPLNVIGLIVQELEDAFENDDLDKESVEYGSKSIMKQVSFMSQIINDFASFFKPSKIDGKIELLATIKSIESLIKPQLIKTGVTVDYSNAENFSTIYVEGSQNEFKQVILNLLVNAKDAIVSRREKTGSNFKGLIKIGLSTSNNMVTLTISDNGGGVDDEVISKLFEPYISSKGNEGTGIGLYLCKLIIDKMKGAIFTRNCDEGAEFVIVLPVE